MQVSSPSTSSPQPNVMQQRMLSLEESEFHERSVDVMTPKVNNGVGESNQQRPTSSTSVHSSQYAVVQLNTTGSTSDAEISHAKVGIFTVFIVLAGK